MDWLSRLNRSLEYIEQNLEEEIDFSEICRISECSAYQFQKIFALMSDISLSDYIRYRRLSKAAFELRHSKAKVIDVALKYGYDSPTAFNRAFQKFHGVSPKSARMPDVLLKTYLPISFHISIKVAVAMDYRIVEQESFRVVGLKMRTTTENDAQFNIITDFWTEACSNGYVPELIEMGKTNPVDHAPSNGILGLCKVEEYTHQPMTLDYYIAVATSAPNKSNWVEWMVPKSRYAVFECIGPIPEAIQRFTKRIFTEWLPSSGYELSDAPDIELYPDGDVRSENYKCEIWVPIK